MLSGSGEGSTMVDADIVFHRSGFPMIPARRIKGMLKESLEEVLEMYGLSAQDIQAHLTALFGLSGQKNNEGKLIFRNLFLEDWAQILQAPQVPSDDEKVLPKAFIKSFFTTEVQQTAIEEKSGVAVEHSLRNYRVLKPGFTFTGNIELQEALTKDELDFFSKAVAHFRYAGTRRNRGFGKIHCKIGPLQNYTQDTTLSPSNPSIRAINVKLQTLSPVVLAQQIGEQNTIFTAREISGNRLRGILAEQYLQKTNLNRTNAHLDPDFYHIFLSGSLKFGNLSYQGAYPIPLHIQYDKTLPDDVETRFSIFDPIDCIAKSVGKTGKIEGSRIEVLSPTTTFAFHNSREDRAAGRSTENQTEGGIFYYESLDEAQEFEGEIQGDALALTKLLSTFNAPIRGSLGRSRSAQYGEVELHFEAIEPDPPQTQTFAADNHLVLTLSSPLVLLNADGNPAPNETTLKNSLAETLGWPEADYEIEKTFSAITSVEQYNAMWVAKSGKYLAYKEGSSFLIKLKKAFQVNGEHFQMGEWTEQGFGAFTLTRFESGQKYVQPRKEAQQLTLSLTDQELPLIKTLIQHYQDSLEEENLKTSAIAQALDTPLKILNNHQIGRLERVFEIKRSESEVQAWINDTKGKPLGEALKKAHLVNDDYEFRFRKDIAKDKYNLQRLFWITFFQTLRKRNKQLSDGN